LGNWAIKQLPNYLLGDNTMKHINRPDIIVFLMAYLCLLSLGGITGGVIVLVIIIPTIQAMGLAFGGSTSMMMAVLGTLSLLVAGVGLWALIGLWRGQANGRSVTMILATMMAVAAGLAVPILLLVGLEGIALFVPLATAVALFIASSSVVWFIQKQK
jgi:hypothetical protein